MIHLNLEIEQFRQALIDMNRSDAKTLLLDVFKRKEGIKLVEYIVIQALESIGDSWENGNCSLAQVYMSGVICEEIMDELIPEMGIIKQENLRIGIVVLQDYHALGKRIVLSILRASGYDVKDFGAGLTVEEIVKVAEHEDLDILIVSTLMLPSALMVRQVKEQLLNIRCRTKIIAGGAPFRFDGELWHKVGADADGKNASDVIGIIKMLMDGGTANELL